MKELFAKYKIVVRFLFLFLGTYFVLSLLYAQYLKFITASNFVVDHITQFVAQQALFLLDILGYNATLQPNISHQTLSLTLNGSYSVSIVEGCNSISVIILFTAFVVAFAEGFKKTMLFILFGVVVIYVINLLRIVLLTVALYKFSNYSEVLHTVVFPGIIYSIVFLLWMGWVRMLKTDSAE